MDRDNYYIILELPFYPPEENTDIIKKQIEKKRNEWSRQAEKAFGKVKNYNKYIEQLSDIKKVMGDAELRKKEYEAAAEIKFSAMMVSMNVMALKGYLFESEVKHLAETNMLSFEVVKQRCGNIEIRKDEVGGKRIKIKKEWQTTYGTGEKYLEALGKKTVYDFLDSDGTFQGIQSFPAARLFTMAKDKYKTYKKNDAESSAGKKLCGFCEIIFKDDHEKAKYDTYERAVSIQQVFKLIIDVVGKRKVLADAQAQSFIEKIIELGEEESDAKSYILGFCEDNGIAWTGRGLNKKIEVCPLCHKLIDVTNDPKNCPVCGKPLYQKCPKCQTENKITVSRCSKCGLDFSNLQKASALCMSALIAIKTLNFELAEDFLSEAKKLWPSLTDITVAESELARQKKRGDKLAKTLQDYISKRRFYTANAELSKIRQVFPEYKDELIIRKISSGISNAKQYMEAAQKANDRNDIINKLMRAFEACQDYPGVLDAMNQYPPKPPVQLQITKDDLGKSNYLRWKLSEQEPYISFIIVKKRDAIPYNVNDGEQLAEISGFSFTDAVQEPGIAWYYGVFSKRGEIYSKGVFSEKPVMNLFDVDNVTLIAGDSSVQVEWGQRPKGAQIEVWRKEKMSPEKPGIGKQVMNLSANGFSDLKLLNDKIYGYTIFAKYNICGSFIYSKGVKIQGIPTVPPHAVEYIMVKQTETKNQFKIEWDEQENGDVQFYYSKKKIAWQRGEKIALGDISKDCSRLAVEKRSDDSGFFTMNADQIYYLIAATVKNETAIIGAMTCVSNKVAVKIENTKLSAGKLHVILRWPEEADRLLLLYRFDHFVSSLEESGSVRKSFKKGQYQLTSSLVIEPVEEKDYYISVFAETRFGDEAGYSLGSNILFRNSRKQEFTFNIRSKRPFSGKSAVIQIRAQEQVFSLPKILVVACNGYPPAFKHSGETIAVIEEQKNVKNVYEYALPLSGVGKDTYIKLFFENEADEKNSELNMEMNTNLKIK